MTDIKDNAARLEELRSYLREHMYFSDRYSPMEKLTMPVKFRNIQPRIRDMEVFEDDIWIITYPRSGTTWGREMLWLIANDLDYKGDETDLMLRFPYIERDCTPFGNKPIDCKYSDTIEYVNNMKRPRFLWSHLPPAMLPSQLLEKKPKIVLVRRNPKDVAVSFYHLLHSTAGYTGTADKFFEAFREGLTPYGCYWHHLAAFQKLQGEPYVLTLTYEDMKQDLMSILKKTANFFGKNYTDDELQKLEDHLSFSKMKTNKTLNFKSEIERIRDIHKVSAPNSEFIRKGIVGDYMNEMSDEAIEKSDEWSREMKIKLNLTDDKRTPY